jgi:alkylhydroperoxidase/carboxymuconolactone decarboxylase family protein YurZ
VGLAQNGRRGAEGKLIVNYTERLCRLAINDAHSLDEGGGQSCSDLMDLDPKTLALARLAALISVGGAIPSYGAHADAAVTAGAKASEIVDMLVALVPIVGLPRVVEAAPKLAMALGFDTVDVSVQQVRFGRHVERGVAIGAPRRLLGHGDARVSEHPLRA